MQILQQTVSKLYSKIMFDIAKYCEAIMVTCSAKFAIVGMGSLARKEITPYSDFELIILLEEGCQSSALYDKILEHYRWFSVIFQIVIINLGETVLPSLAIPSLNDFYCDKPNWFYDVVTPRGVSFDGMMPYASKIPLGRQEPTPAKPWATELIRPVSMMLHYLSSEENLRNGYHLSDILTETCFV